MELVLATFVGGILTMVSLMIMQRNKERTLELNKKYEIDLLKVRKREGRKDKKIAAEIQTKPPRNIIDSLKGLDLKKIQPLIDLVQGDDYEHIEDDDGIGSIISGFVSENPEIVNGLLQGVTKNSGQDPDQDKNYNRLLFD